MRTLKRKLLYIPILIYLILINFHLSFAQTDPNWEISFKNQAGYEQLPSSNLSIPVFLLGQKLSWSYHLVGELEDFKNGLEIITSFHYRTDRECNAWWLESPTTMNNYELFFSKDSILKDTMPIVFKISSDSPNVDFKNLGNYEFTLPLQYRNCPGFIYSKTIITTPLGEKILIIKDLLLKFNLQDPLLK